MVMLLCYTSAFSEVIYVDFYAIILHWNCRLVDKNSQILIVVFVSNLNFSFSFRFVDENCRIFVVVVIFVTKINLFLSTKIFVFVVVDEKNTGWDGSGTSWTICEPFAACCRQISTSSLKFCSQMFFVVPNAHPTMSKHWRLYVDTKLI